MMYGEIQRPFLADFLLLRYHMSADNCQRALVDKLGMIIRSQMGMHKRPEMVAVQGSPFATTPWK
jgi:hypothetical protein